MDTLPILVGLMGWYARDKQVNKWALRMSFESERKAKQEAGKKVLWVWGHCCR